MSHPPHSDRLRRFSLEAVPTSDGQFQAIFRIHLDGALSADDELYFGDTSEDPLRAFDEARAMAVKYWSRTAVIG
ncbi:MAG: hypothetical protein ACRYHA_26905 [Janthinobacterium lividum]